jgi:hypothetical protein
VAVNRIPLFVRLCAAGIAVAIGAGALCRPEAIVKVGPPSVSVTEPTGVKVESGAIPISVKLGGGWAATGLLMLVAAWRARRYRQVTDRLVTAIEGDEMAACIKHKVRTADALNCWLHGRVKALGYAKGTKR